MSTPIITQNASPEQLREELQFLRARVEEMEARNLDNIDGWAGNQSNVSESRAFDADNASLDELADTLGTLIKDLTDKGVLR